MRIGVPKEVAPGERRVALVPETVARLGKSGHLIVVERGAGRLAGFSDAAYADAGALIATRERVYVEAEILCKVARPSVDHAAGMNELALVAPGTVLIGFLGPLESPAYVHALAELRITGMSMESIPRTTRAQAMDALSSQSSLAGYKAVILAASILPKFFPMMTTAAGTIAPARILVIGAGVAGLQAIATARRLGAVVSAYDARAAVGEQVKSLGAQFLPLVLEETAEAAGGYARELSQTSVTRQRAFLGEHAAKSDVVIMTAQIPGRPAPLLLEAAAVAGMRPGSVVVDLAAESGGNCEVTVAGETVDMYGITVMGPRNLAATLPADASKLYSRNVSALIEYCMKDGRVALDFTDEIIRGTCITHDGRVLHPPTLALGGRS